LNFSDFGIKLILVLLHNVDKLVFLFVEIVALLLDLLVSVTWGSKQAPLSVKVFLLSKLVLEFVEDAVHFHSYSDFILKLGNLTGCTTHLVFDSRQVFNVLRGTLNGQIQPIKGIHCSVGHHLCLLGNELDDLGSDFLVLCGNDVTDATAVHSEHRDNAAVLDFFSKLFGLLGVLNDQLTKLRRLWLAFFVGEGSDHFLGVELVLFTVHLEGLEVLVKIGNALINFLHEAMVLFVDPSVLIWQSFFVSSIGCFWHFLRLLRHFQVHLLVRLEEVRHELLFELGDLFKTHQAVVKSVEDNENDIGRLVAVDDLIVLVKH